MKYSVCLFAVLFGTVLFYVGNEFMFRNIQHWTWIQERLLFGVGFGGLCLALIGLLTAYQFAMNALYALFPEHLVRMYRGLQCDADLICHHRAQYGVETKKELKNKQWLI